MDQSPPVSQPSLVQYCVVTTSPLFNTLNQLQRRSGSPPRNNDGSPMNSAINTPSRRHFASPPGSRGNRADASTVYSDRFIPSRLSTNLEDAFDMMENRESLSKDYVRGDAKHENQAYMSNLLRSELLGQSVVHNTDPRMDGQIGSPARKEGSSSNLFKYRTSQVILLYFVLSFCNSGPALVGNYVAHRSFPSLFSDLSFV